jgi:hypothetical protein
MDIIRPNTSLLLCYKIPLYLFFIVLVWIHCWGGEINIWVQSAPISNAFLNEVSSETAAETCAPILGPLGTERAVLIFGTERAVLTFDIPRV